MNAGELTSSGDQGAWVKYKDIYSSPTELLKDEFRSMRRMIPDSMRRNLPAENIPEDHEMGRPYPLDIEIISLFVNGFAGTSPESLLTIEELSASLKDIYSGDEWPEVEKLIKGKFETLQERVRRNNEILDLQIEIDRKRSLSTTLDSWNPLRIEKFLEIAGLTESIDSLKSLYAGLVEGMPDNNYDALHPTLEQYLLIISPIFQLTPHELEDIARIERNEGYLYLDSLVSAIHQLAPSYTEALRVEIETSQFGNSSYTSDSGISSREGIIRGYLRYGAGSSTAVRSEAEKLFGAGKQLPNHPPEIPMIDL